MYSYRLKAFHAIATSGSFSRAAWEILHISQPAVSQHVQARELTGVSGLVVPRRLQALPERPHAPSGLRS